MSRLTLLGVGGPVSAAAPANAFIAATKSDGTQHNSHTFAGQSLGTAHATRSIHVAMVSEYMGGGAGGPNYATVTVAGNSATINVQAAESGNGMFCGIASLALASGTTGDIVVTNDASGQESHLTIAVFACYGLASLTPVDTTTYTAGDPVDVSTDTSSGGVVFGCAGLQAGAGSTTTGLTEDHDDDLIHTGSRAVLGHAFSTAAATPRTITFNRGGGFGGGVAASFA